uniref:DNA pilot protein n=1 Tax=Dulem virus 191 TaxID=3145668 RepID=A0AAU8B756_9VIRU
MAINWSGIGEGAISGAIGAIGNLFTGGMSARKQYKYQSKLMDKQNQQQIDFWNMNNEYNTPLAQRARLEEAGLNPDLMYGGSGSVAQSQMPGAAAGSAPNVDYGDTSGAFANGIRLAQQASLIDAQVSKIEAENKLLAEQALSQAEQRELWKAQATDAWLRAEHQGIYNKHADTRYFLENETRSLKNTLLGADVNSYETRLRLDQQRVANDNMRAKVQVLQLGLNEKKLKADMEKIRAEVSEIMSRVKVNNVTERKVVAEAIEAELLNKYYYSNGRVPNGTVAQDLVRRVQSWFEDGSFPITPISMIP